MNLTSTVHLRLSPAIWLCVTASAILLAGAAARGENSPGPGAPLGLDVRPQFKLIDSVAELRRWFAASGQQIRMKPGVYRIPAVEPDNKTVFHVTGSNNYFDLRGVTLQLDTKLLAAMRGKVHELSGYRVHGSNLTFEGATFEDVGDEPPYTSLSDFDVIGADNTFKDCTFIVRGSAPYGYGDLFGKGAGAKVRLQKHAAMSVRGDRTKILGCRYTIHTFGHAIHMHGSRSTLVQDVFVEGQLRLSDEILAEQTGPAAKLRYRDHYDRPIRRGLMICLAEDGIRAYLDEGGAKPQRRTGDVTVVNCTVKRMRGGIALELASGKVEVRGCTVTESGYPGAAYGVPSNALVRDCRGDAAFAPLLHLGYSHKHHADVELELLDAQHYQGNDLLALINGSSHRVTIRAPDGAPRAPNLKVLCGESLRGDQADLGKTYTKDLTIINHTNQEVVLSPLCSGCTVTSAGIVTDRGANNEAVRLPDRER